MIDVAKCPYCGDTVMTGFLSAHIIYVHKAQEETVNSRKKQKICAHKKKETNCRKVVVMENLSARTQKIINVSDEKELPSHIVCILCGEKVPKGHLLKHKRDIHGEKIGSQPTINRRKNTQWVRFIQGGLPSLGKRHR